jgi:hypothetical protein
MTEPWRQWAAELERHKPRLVATFFRLAMHEYEIGGTMGVMGIGYRCRELGVEPFDNHSVTVLARMWHDRHPDKPLFELRASVLDGWQSNPGQPDLFGAMP